MEIVKTFIRNGSYIELTTDKEKIVIPSDKAIFVDDTSGFVSLKGVATRKTLYLIPDDVYNGGGGDDPEYSEQYLTIESLDDDNAIGWKLNDNTAVAKNISYSTDGGQTWATTRATAEGTVIATLNSGDKLLLKGNETTYYGGVNKHSYFTSTGQFNLYGNIMSLLYSDDFENADTLTAEDYIFYHLFSNTKVVSAENLVLPATTLTMGCYSGIFTGCTSLNAAPELPATTLADFCYSAMFFGCTSLTTAPTLPAATLASGCYGAMFSGCTSLNYIKMLATDISAGGTPWWVSGVSATGTFVKNAAMTALPTGDSGIPTGWEVQDA